jgi:hypothetical protein
LSGARWTTGIGIAVGGVGGAVAALLGAPKAPPPPAPLAAQAASPRAAPTPTAATPVIRASAVSPPTQELTPPEPVAKGAAEAVAAAAPSPGKGPVAAPILQPPSTREALHKAMLFCDQKRDFDECERAALALEQGTTGPADAQQAKRFRRIALTHLVAQCETGVPHACFVLSAKYRAGTELAASATSADALEERGLSLCRLRSAPECPAP